jgi:hypothetical protein
VSARADVQPLPGWLAWPIRVLAVVFVVPFKLAWEALAWVLRVLWRYVGAPITEHVIQPLLYYVIWLPLRWVTVYLLWTPLAWLARRVIAPAAAALWHAAVRLGRALAPLRRVLGRILGWVLLVLDRVLHQVGRVLAEVGRAVGWAMRQLYGYVLTPVGKALALLWRWVVVPVAAAVAWAWNHSVVLLWRYLVVIPLRFVWRHAVVPPARWVHEWVLRPVAETTRRVLATLGLR